MADVKTAAKDPPAKITTEPLAPIPITMIGRGDGQTPYGEIETPGKHKPNLIIQVVSPLAAILIRFVNAFLAQLVGLLVAAMTPAGGQVLYTSDFFHAVLLCSSLALPGAGLGLIKDCITIFSRLEQKYPLATGSV